MDEYLSHFARRLAGLIQGNGVTCNRLSQDTGLHEEYLYALLRDEKAPTAEVLDRISRYFEVPIATLKPPPDEETLKAKPSEEDAVGAVLGDTVREVPVVPTLKEIEAFARVFEGAALSEREHARWVEELYDRPGRHVTVEDLRLLLTQRVNRSTASADDKRLVLRFVSRAWREARLLAVRASAAVARRSAV